MTMKSVKIMVIAGMLTATASLNAGQVDGSAVLGSAIGAAAGTAIGSAAGGKDGAIIGGGIGGALGAAAGSNSEPVHTSGSTRVIVRDDYDGRHDNGKHKGHYKQHRH